MRIDVRQSGEFAAAVRLAKSSGKLTALPDIQLKTDLILATAIAYSVNGRLAAQLDRLQGLGFMPSSVVGGGGSAAATAKLMKLDAERTLSALGLGIGGGGGLFQYYFDQTEDKKLHVARAAISMACSSNWRRLPPTRR